MPHEPPGNRRPRWMVTLDRIRLTGLLRRPLLTQGSLSSSGPRYGGALFVDARRRRREHDSDIDFRFARVRNSSQSLGVGGEAGRS